MEPYQSRVYDHQKKVTEGKNGRTLVLKEHEDFNIVFASNKIEIAESWLIGIIQRFNNGIETWFYHAGLPFSKDPISIGPVKVYNSVDMPDVKHLDRVYFRVSSAGASEQLTNIISHVIFSVAKSWSPSPLSHFFHQISQKYLRRLDAEGVILRDEDEVLEYKSEEWFYDDDDTLSKKITKEIQKETRLIIGGVDEGQQKIRPINSSRFDSERGRRIEEKVRGLNGNHSSVIIRRIQLGDDGCLLFVFGTKDEVESDIFRPLT